MDNDMEKKKLRYTDESKELDLENLEIIAGGAGRLSPEKYQRYLELQAKFEKAKEAYANGTGTQAEVDSAREEMLAFIRNS